MTRSEILDECAAVGRELALAVAFKKPRRVAILKRKAKALAMAYYSCKIVCAKDYDKTRALRLNKNAAMWAARDAARAAAWAAWWAARAAAWEAGPGDLTALYCEAWEVA